MTMASALAVAVNRGSCMVKLTGAFPTPKSMATEVAPKAPSQVKLPVASAASGSCGNESKTGPVTAASSWHSTAKSALVGSESPMTKKE